MHHNGWFYGSLCTCALEHMIYPIPICKTILFKNGKCYQCQPFNWQSIFEIKKDFHVCISKYHKNLKNMSQH